MDEEATREALKQLYYASYRKNITNPTAQPAMPDAFVESHIKEIGTGTRQWDQHKALRRVEQLRQLMT